MPSCRLLVVSDEDMPDKLAAERTPAGRCEKLRPPGEAGGSPDVTRESATTGMNAGARPL
jgi:hypothetical protein